MHTPSKLAPRDSEQTVDLASIGQDWVATRQSAELTPEVADVLTGLPAWVARGLLYLVAGFVVVALIWAAFSKVDMTVNARGTLVPEGYVRPVQAAASGVVQQVLVHEGDAVEKGQVLVQLDATEARNRLRKLREELATSQEQLRRLLALNGPASETLDQQNRLARLQSDLTATEIGVQNATVKAPFAGIVTALDIRGTGAVLQAGQTVLSVAPAGMRLVLDVQVPNRDIALIDKGLPVKLQFDAFPWQDYGAVEGTVVEISPDAQSPAGQEPFYKVKIAPQQTDIIARGKRLPLRNGLTATALIITERRSVLSLILEPVYKLKAEI